MPTLLSWTHYLAAAVSLWSVILHGIYLILFPALQICNQAQYDKHRNRCQINQTNGQNNVTQSRITAAHRRFYSIRQMAPMSTPSNTWCPGPTRLSISNCISIDTAVLHSSRQRVPIHYNGPPQCMAILTTCQQLNSGQVRLEHLRRVSHFFATSCQLWLTQISRFGCETHF